MGKICHESRRISSQNLIGVMGEKIFVFIDGRSHRVQLLNVHKNECVLVSRSISKETKRANVS